MRVDGDTDTGVAWGRAERQDERRVVRQWRERLARHLEEGVRADDGSGAADGRDRREAVGRDARRARRRDINSEDADLLTELREAACREVPRLLGAEPHDWTAGRYNVQRCDPTADGDSWSQRQRGRVWQENADKDRQRSDRLDWHESMVRYPVNGKREGGATGRPRPVTLELAPYAPIAPVKMSNSSSPSTAIPETNTGGFDSGRDRRCLVDSTFNANNGASSGVGRTATTFPPATLIDSNKVATSSFRRSGRALRQRAGRSSASRDAWAIRRSSGMRLDRSKRACANASSSL